VDPFDILKAGQAAPGGDENPHAAARENRADLSFLGS
jgi:hypothetical protein